jgi:hypothetical protein
VLIAYRTALIKHREFNDHPIEVVTQHFTSLQHHCKTAALKGPDARAETRRYQSLVRFECAKGWREKPLSQPNHTGPSARGKSLLGYDTPDLRQARSLMQNLRVGQKKAERVRAAED